MSHETREEILRGPLSNGDDTRVMSEDDGTGPGKVWRDLGHVSVPCLDYKSRPQLLESSSAASSYIKISYHHHHCQGHSHPRSKGQRHFSYHLILVSRQ